MSPSISAIIETSKLVKTLISVPKRKRFHFRFIRTAAIPYIHCLAYIDCHKKRFFIRSIVKGKI